MLTGRFQLAAPGDKLPTKTAVVLGFGPRAGAAGATPHAWTRGRRVAAGRRRPRRGPLPRPDPDGQDLPPARPASTAPCPGLGDADQGPDADDPALTLEVWRERIRRHPGRAQEPAAQPVVRGRDRQRLQRRDPARGAAAAVPQAVEPRAPRRSTRCTTATRTTLADAIDVLRERVPPTFEKQVRDFLAVHDKGGQPCPRCGTRITEVSAGGFITSYCRGCQR